MNQLKLEKQKMIATLLVEGNSIRSIERITGVHRDTIMRFGIKLGENAQQISDTLMTNIKCNFLQVDEIWTFVGKKQKRLTREERKENILGDQYIYVAIDAETKLVPHYEIGRRNFECALRFLEEVRRRITGRFQLTTDSFKAYPQAVREVSNNDIDFAQIEKIYNESYEQKQQKRYSPANIIRTIKNPVLGVPYYSKISTSYVERQNLTMRMQMRRLTRLTNAFSKKLYNLQCAIALHFFYYNFMRKHLTLKATPAMESGVTNHIWTWEDLLNYSSLSKAA